MFFHSIKRSRGARVLFFHTIKLSRGARDLFLYNQTYIEMFEIGRDVEAKNASQQRMLIPHKNSGFVGVTILTLSSL